MALTKCSVCCDVSGLFFYLSQYVCLSCWDCNVDCMLIVVVIGCVANKTNPIPKSPLTRPHQRLETDWSILGQMYTYVTCCNPCCQVQITKHDSTNTMFVVLNGAVDWLVGRSVGWQHSWLSWAMFKQQLVYLVDLKILHRHKKHSRWVWFAFVLSVAFGFPFCRVLAFRDKMFKADARVLHKHMVYSV